jgi:hypothetical protein
LVGGCDINEDVPGVECDFAVLRVDDWGHREYLVVRIVYDGVDRGVANYGKIFCKVLFRLEIMLLISRCEKREAFSFTSYRTISSSAE